MKDILILILTLSGAAFAQYRSAGGTVEIGGRLVPFRVVHGLAVIDGDILIGPAARLRSSGRMAVVHSEPGRRWTDGVIPYTIDPDIPSAERIREAIDHWNQKTPLRLKPREAETNYVEFLRLNSGGVCYSAIGMTGGPQNITVDDSCGAGTLIHEIGHAVGFWHEQSRHDRDAFVDVLYNNVQAAQRGQFEVHLNDGEDLGDYDYTSVMHYGPYSFSEGGGPSIVSIPPGIPFGFATGLSAADLDAVRRLYGYPAEGVTVTTNPEGIPLDVDSRRYTSPQTFPWVSGSAHTLRVPPEPVEPEPGVRWVFARWSHGGDASQSVQIGADRSVYVAHFRKEIRLFAGSTDSAKGEVRVDPPSADGYYPEGSEVRITAVPREGQSFFGWTEREGRRDHGRALNPVTLRTFQPVRYLAEFRPAPFTSITTDPLGFAVTIDGVQTATPINLAWKDGSSHTLEPMPVRPAPPDADTRILDPRWSDGGPLIRTVTATPAGSSFQAVYPRQFRLETGRETVVTPSSPDGYYEEGAPIAVSASVTPPAQFTNWMGDASGNQLPLMWTMSGPAFLQANSSLPGVITGSSIVNGASLQWGGLSPGQIITIFGAGIGPETGVSTTVDPGTGRFPVEAAGVRVRMAGKAAPLLYVSSRQVNTVVPFGLGDVRSLLVELSYNGILTTNEYFVVPAVPAIFSLNGSGRGPAAALNEDYSVNSAGNPARRGSVVMVYCAGLGETDPPSVDGQPAKEPLPRPVQPVIVRVGERRAAVLYAGAAPGLVAGAFQLNVLVPDDAPSGSAVPIEIQARNAVSPVGITLAIE